MSGEVVFAAAISEHCTCHPKGRQHASIVAAGRERARVAIDPNVRVRGNATYSGLDDVTGPLAVGATVEVYEPESGLAGEGLVTEIDEGRRLVYLSVDWPSLTVNPARRGLKPGAVLRVVVDLVWYGHPSGAVARMAELNEKHDPLAVIVDAGSQSGTLLRPLADAGVWVTSPTVRDVAVAHGEFLDLVQAGGLEHLDQPPLTAAVRAGQQRLLAGAQAWDRRNVQVDQSPVEAATLAVHGFIAWEALAEPGTWAI